MKVNKISGKIIASVLAVVLMLGVLPIGANAVEPSQFASEITCATLVPGDGEVKVTITNGKPGKVYMYEIVSADLVDLYITGYTTNAVSRPVENVGEGESCHIVTGSAIIPATNGEEIHILVYECDPLEVIRQDRYGYWLYGLQHLSTTPQAGLSFPVDSEPEGNTWSPTTPEEIERASYWRHEDVDFWFTGNNEIAAEGMAQGPKCIEVMKAAAGDAKIALTYNIFANGSSYADKVYETKEMATIGIRIPKDYLKEGRTFSMICVSENGVPYVLADLDDKDDWITFETNHFFAFALIYTDAK